VSNFLFAGNFGLIGTAYGCDPLEKFDVTFHCQQPITVGTPKSLGVSSVMNMLNEYAGGGGGVCESANGPDSLVTPFSPYSFNLQNSLGFAMHRRRSPAREM
jgi:hypothetical protein